MPIIEVASLFLSIMAFSLAIASASDKAGSMISGFFERSFAGTALAMNSSSEAAPRIFNMAAISAALGPTWRGKKDDVMVQPATNAS